MALIDPAPCLVEFPGLILRFYIQIRASVSVARSLTSAEPRVGSLILALISTPPNKLSSFLCSHFYPPYNLIHIHTYIVTGFLKGCVSGVLFIKGADISI
jgi:hypothetical protein